MKRNKNFKNFLKESFDSKYKFHVEKTAFSFVGKFYTENSVYTAQASLVNQKKEIWNFSLGSPITDPENALKILSTAYAILENFTNVYHPLKVTLFPQDVNQEVRIFKKIWAKKPFKDYKAIFKPNQVILQFIGKKF